VIFSKLTVVVKEGVVGRPTKEDLVFLWHADDGSSWEYEGPTVSPSGYGKFDACRRKWGLYAIDKIPQKEKAASKLGLEAHGYLEDWQTLSIPPPPTTVGSRMLDTGVLEHFPPPGTARSEEVFAFAFSPTDDVDDAVVFWGYKDVELDAEVLDLKSTGDMRWAKTHQELLEDPQAIIYAADNMLVTRQHSATCTWVYFTVKGKKECRVVSVTMGLEHVVLGLLRFYPQALEMTRIRFENVLRGEDLPQNATHCGAFGGCDYMDMCKGTLRKGSVLSALRRQSKLEVQRKEHEDMASVMDKVRSVMAKSGKEAPPPAASVQVNKPPARPLPAAGKAPPPRAAPAAPPRPAAPAKPVAPAKPASKAAVVAPAKGRLAAAAAAVGTGKPHTPARGVNPPDAAEPSLEADADDLEAAAEDDGEAGEQEPEDVAEPEPEPEPAPQRAAPRAPAKPAVAPAKPAPAKAAAPKPKPAPAPEPEPAEPVEEKIPGFALLIDVVLTGMEDAQDGQALVDEARHALESESGPYRLIEFNKGPSLLAVQLSELLMGAQPAGWFTLTSQRLDREVLDVLMRHASIVVQGR